MFDPCDRRHVRSAAVVSRKINILKGKHTCGMFAWTELFFFHRGFNFRRQRKKRHVLESVAENVASFKDATIHWCQTERNLSHKRQRQKTGMPDSRMTSGLEWCAAFSRVVALWCAILLLLMFSFKIMGRGLQAEAEKKKKGISLLAGECWICPLKWLILRDIQSRIQTTLLIPPRGNLFERLWLWPQDVNST